MNLQQLLPFLLIAVLIIPMVLMSRKQKKAAAQQQELQSSIDVGDRVMTTSGLYATVADASDDATVKLEIAPGVVTEWLRAAVREKIGPDLVEDDEEELVDEVDEVDETPLDDTKDDTKVTADSTKSTAEIAPPLEHGKR